MTDFDTLAALERRVLWLASWTIHAANHLRPADDLDVKVGGHQASCASMATLMTALYFHVLRPEDRVAVKPHAGPVYHAIQYLAGNQTLDNLRNFRGFKGAQSYPSRTKDKAPTSSKPAAPAKARLGYKRERALFELPKKIEALQAEIATLQQALADPDLYRRDPKSFQSKTTRIGAAQAEIEAAETEWLELEMLREELNS